MGNVSACVFTACNMVLHSQIPGNKINESDTNKIKTYVAYSAERNNLLAQGAWANFCLCDENNEEAIKWANVAYNRLMAGVELPDSIMGEIQGSIGEVLVAQGDYRKGCSMLEKAVKNKNYEAANRLGYMYQHGNGVDVDYVKAIEYYRFAAVNDEPIAQYNLGFMYDEGLGVTKDKEEALKWTKRSAENDCATAQYVMGVDSLPKDSDVNKDYSEALKWLKLAANHDGHEDGSDEAVLEAHIMLMSIYLGCIDENLADYSQGVNLGEQLYKKYETNAEFRKRIVEEVVPLLGIMYREGGHGIEKFPQYSIYWFEISANEGRASSQCALGQAYALGDGIPKDYQKAKYWLEKSASQGFERAATELAALNTLINSERENKKVSSSDDDGFKEIMIAVVAGGLSLAAFPPLGIIIIAWLFLYKIPNENKKIKKTK